MREAETPQDPDDDTESGYPPPPTGEIESGGERDDDEESITPTPPRSGTPSSGVAPPMSQAGTDDSVEIILS